MKRKKKTKTPKVAKGLPAIPIHCSGTAFFGIDLHRKTFTMAVIDADGEILLLVQLDTNADNLIAAVNAVSANEKIVTIEEISPTRWAVGLLKPHADDVFANDPKHNSWIANDPGKKDSVDALKQAKLCRLDELKAIYYEADEDRYAFKVAMQNYHDIKAKVVTSKNQIKAHLFRAGIQYPDGDQVFAKKNRPHYLDQLTGPWRDRLEFFYRNYDFLFAEKKAAQADYEAYAKKKGFSEVANMLTINGGGTESVHTFVATIMNPDRFEHVGQLYRYCSLSITDKSSDGKSLGYQRLDKKGGHVQLKQCSYRIFLAGVRNDTEIKTYYEAAKKANGGSTTKARLTTQRKIIKTLWTIWKSGEPYNPDLFVYQHRRPVIENTPRKQRKTDAAGKSHVEYQLDTPATTSAQETPKLRTSRTRKE